MILFVSILAAGMADWPDARAEQTHIDVTEEQLHAALRIAPEAMEAINPLLDEAFQRRMSALESGEVNVEKVRYATLVWHDSKTQADIIQENGDTRRILENTNLTPLAFTQTIRLTELVLLRLAPDAPSSKELEEQANDITRLHKGIVERKIEGSELAQWQLSLPMEARIQMQIQALSLDEENVKLVERNRAYIPELITGDIIGDWMSVRMIDKAKRRAAVNGWKWPPNK